MRLIVRFGGFLLWILLVTAAQAQVGGGGGGGGVIPNTCGAGSFFSAVTLQGAFTCGTGISAGTINSGGPQAIAIYSGSGTTVGPGTLASGLVLSAGQLAPDLTVLAPLASPNFTGTPAAPTPQTGTNTAQIATTAYVKNQGYLIGITGTQVTTALGYTPVPNTATITTTGPLAGGGSLVGNALTLSLGGPSNLSTFAAGAIPKGAGGSPFAASSITDAGGGVTVGSPTGGAKGAGTLNATAIYQNGVQVGSGTGTGTVTGPVSSTNGFVPQWNGTGGTALSAGLPVGASGNSTIIETTSSGLLTPSILPLATSSALGAIQSDGTTTSINGSGVLRAIGTPGGTSGQIQYNNGVGAFAGFTASGSCTITAVTGAVTCNLGGTPLQTYTIQGSTTKIPTVSGTFAAANDYVLVDANGNLIDGGTLTSSKVTTALGYTPLSPANNLSDLTSAATGRTNLGLGSIATQSAAAVNLTGGTINSVAITGLSNPVNPPDAAPKSYVDAAVTGAISHTQVAVATAAILPNTPTYSNGSSGVGATLTSAASTTLTVDGQSVANGQRVLVKNEATAANNGIYVATIGGSPWVLTRANDFNAATAGNLALGAYVFVATGTVNCSPTCTIWQLGAPTPTPITIGTTALTFNMIGAAGSSSVALTASTSNLVVTGSPGNVLTVGSTVALDTQSGNSVFAIPSADNQKTVYRTNTVAEADTIANPTTGGFGSGFGLRYFSTTAGQSITPGGGTFNGLASLTLGANQGLSLFSSGTNYGALLGLPTPATQASTTFLLDNMTWSQVNTAQLASSAVTTAKIASSVSLTTPTIAGGTFSGTIAGTPTYSGVPIFSGLSAGTCVNGLALDSGNHVVTVACAGAGGTLTTTDGTNTVSATTTQTFGNCFVIGGSAGSATINLTQKVTSQTGAGYTFAATDACSTVEVAGNTYVYPLGTVGPGFGVRVHNVSTSANATLTATGGNFTGTGVANASSFTLIPGQYADITSIAGPLALVQLSGAGTSSSGNGLSGMTPGQLPIAATSNTITSSIATGVTGSGTFVPQTSGGTLSTTVLPQASGSGLGIVQGDNNSVAINVNGVISVVPEGVVASDELNITATGSVGGGPATAYALTKSFSEVLTVPPGTCVKLPPFMALVGRMVRVASYGANPLCVFPASSSGTICVSGICGAANAAVTVQPGVVATYESVSTTKVYQEP